MPFPWELARAWCGGSVPASLSGGAGNPFQPTGAALHCWKSGIWVSVGLCAHPGGELRRSCFTTGGLGREGSRTLVSLQPQIRPVGKAVRQSLGQQEGEDDASVDEGNKEL